MTCAPSLVVRRYPIPTDVVVDVVIPIHDEEAILETSVRRLHAYLSARFPLSWTITLVDNASTDSTWGIACRLATELDRLQALHLDEKGRGRALRCAWSTSAAPVAAYMDVDLSTDLDALLPLVAPLVSGHSDLAIGTRLDPLSRVVRGPRRELISRSYNLLLKAALHNDFSDAQCGFKAVRTDVARTLLPLVEDEGWFFDTELLVLAEHNGLRIHEVPVDWVDDPDSRVDLVSTARDDLLGIWRMLGRSFAGRTRVPAHLDHARGIPQDGLAAQLACFASIGVVSTIVFGALFGLLLDPVGPLVAVILALAVCSIANTAANRRLTFGLRGTTGRRRHYAAALALAVLPLALTLTTLATLSALGTASDTVLIAALTASSGLAAIIRFVGLRHWAFRPLATPASAPATAPAPPPVSPPAARR